MNVLFINLLSPEKKRRVNELISFIFIKNLLEITAFIVSVAGIFVLGGWLVVISGYNQLAASAISINKEYGAHNQDTRNINKTLHNINSSAENYLPLTEKLVMFMNSIPAGITLNLIDLDRTKESITVSGNASDRAVLLEYHDILKKVDWITDISAPSSQLFQKENIYFEIKAELKGMPAAGQLPEKTKK